MITQVAQDTPRQTDRPTVWGLTPVELHDRFWAARGVQVVRHGEQSEIVEGAELFLLMSSRLLTIYRLRQAVDQLSWLHPDVLWVRLSDSREHGYQEVAVTDEQDRFIRFQRSYGVSDARLARVELAPNHLSAQYALRVAARSAPRTLSRTSSLVKILIATDDMHGLMWLDQRAVTRQQLPAAVVREARRDLGSIRRILHKDMQPVYQAFMAFIAAADAAAGTGDARRSSAKAPQKRLKSARQRLLGAFRDLQTDRQMLEKLLREGT